MSYPHLQDLPMLAKQLSEAIEYIATEIGNSFETESGREEVRPKGARNFVFGSGTDGAICRDVSVPLSYLVGTGARTGNEELDNSIEEHISRCYTLALDNFLAANPSVMSMEVFGGDKDEVSYHSLYEADQGSLAEELSEFETLLLDAIDVCIRIGAFFYNASNEGFTVPLPGKASVTLWSTGFIDGGGFMVGPFSPVGKAFTFYSAYVELGDNIVPTKAIETFRKEACE